MLRLTVPVLVWSMFLTSAAAFGESQRWHKFSQDADLTYFIDNGSIMKTRAGTYIFWVKETPAKKDFLKNQYKMDELDHVLFNYEIDCDKGIYKTRGIIYYDSKEEILDKQIPLVTDMSDAEPIPPESVIELAEDYVCPAAEEPSVQTQH